jgi:hypothetical protein
MNVDLIDMTVNYGTLEQFHFLSSQVGVTHSQTS